LDQKQMVTSFHISAMAQRLYYEPEHLALKAAINKCIEQKKSISR